jgi:ribosomal subunit interface protein
MQLSVNGRHLDIGDALRSHIEDSLNGIFEKYFGDAIDAKVTLSQSGPMYHAQVNVNVGRGIHLSAENKADRIYPAFDGAADRLAKRLRRYKRRLQDHHKKAADTAEAEVEAAQYRVLAGQTDGQDAGAAAAADDGLDGQPAVVAEMACDIPSLSVSEAVMRLELADAPAMMFRNAAHGGLNMIYRRSDGHVGWIDPEGNGA